MTTEAQPQTDEQFKATADSLRNSPLGPGESQADRAGKLEAHYKARFPEPTGAEQAGTDGPQGQQAQPEINWGDAPEQQVTEADGKLRSAIGNALCRDYGCSSNEAQSGIQFFRQAFEDGPLTDDEWYATEDHTASVLKAKWGNQYDSKVTRAYAAWDEFKQRFSHPDLEQAEENGLLINPEFLMWLSNIAERRAPAQRDAKAITKELASVNQGSPRAKQLEQEQEAAYKKLYGTGPA
jgi:hypothetical protein